MTTPAELRQLAAAGAAEAQRLVMLPATLLGTQEGLRSIAREIVGLCNRDGGRVVLQAALPDAIGATPAGAAIDRSAGVAAIGEVASRLISPPVAVDFELLQDSGSTALVLHVPRRAAGPHRSDTVYVRIGDRTRTATTEQVDWLERVAGDAETTAVSALRIDVRGALPVAPSGIGADFKALLERLPATYAEALAANPERLATAYAELAPWVLLRQVDAVFADRPDARPVPLEDLAVPRSSEFAAVPGGLPGILGAASGIAARLWNRRRVTFRLPPGCEPHVDVHRHRRMGRVMLAHAAWSTTLSAQPADDQAAAGSVHLHIEHSRVLAFPERAGQSAAQNDAELVNGVVQARWAQRGDAPAGH